MGIGLAERRWEFISLFLLTNIFSRGRKSGHLGPKNPEKWHVSRRVLASLTQDLACFARVLAGLTQDFAGCRGRDEGKDGIGDRKENVWLEPPLLWYAFCNILASESIGDSTLAPCSPGGSPLARDPADKTG